MKRWLKVAMLAPIIVVWDVTFFIVDKLHQGMVWIDREGGLIIDDFLEDE